MNKEKLIIKNFGPIKSVDLDLGKITVLIGEQATGKSTIAKVLSICRYFSYIVNFSDNETQQLKFTKNSQFLGGLKDWGIEDYLKDDSYIFYKNKHYDFEFKNVLIVEYENIALGDDLKKAYCEVQTRIKPNSKSFKELLIQLFNLKKETFENAIKVEDLVNLISWYPNENFFRLNVKKVLDNPLFIPAERGFQSISVSKDSLLPDAILDELSKINRIVRGFRLDVNIKPLNLVFKNENGISKIKKSNDDEFYYLHKGASGYQSTIPIVLVVKFYSETEKRQRTFIVEEPEINLFPSTQKKLMEFFVKNINSNGHSFLIPTHSPYFLSAINDLLVAYKKGQLNPEETKKIIKEEEWLNSNDLSVYELKNGKALDIFDKELGLISDNIIDDVTDEMDEQFENLLQIK